MRIRIKVKGKQYEVGVAETDGDCRRCDVQKYIYVAENPGEEDEDDILQVTLPMIVFVPGHLYARSPLMTCIRPCHCKQ